MAGKAVLLGLDRGSMGFAGSSFFDDPRSLAQRDAIEALRQLAQAKRP